MFGAFVVWNKDQPGTGLEVKASIGYETNTTQTTRSVYGTSEAGVGSASLATFGASVVASYAMPTINDMTTTPYAGLRYTNLALAATQRVHQAQ
jgi:hypothetical protein